MQRKLCTQKKAPLEADLRRGQVCSPRVFTVSVSDILTLLLLLFDTDQCVRISFLNRENRKISTTI